MFEGHCPSWESNSKLNSEGGISRTGLPMQDEELPTRRLQPPDICFHSFLQPGGAEDVASKETRKGLPLKNVYYKIKQ